MDIQAFTTSRYGVAVALFLARTLPTWAGYWVGRRLADLIYLFRHSALVEAVRVNQYVVSGGTLRGKALERRVRQVLHHGARCAYDFYHHLNDRERVRRLVHLDDRCYELIEQSLNPQPGRGVVVVGPHLSNFDLGMHAFALEGIDAQVLSIATTTSGYAWQNEIRSVGRLKVTPVSPASLKDAMRRLRRGGIVVTGVERPVPGRSETLIFFGRPARLPVGHVRMAMDAEVPVRVVSCRMSPERRYHCTVSAPIPMETTGDRRADIRANAQKVLAVIEDLIRQTPEQWLMYYPVWPEALEELR